MYSLLFLDTNMDCIKKKIIHLSKSLEEALLLLRKHEMEHTLRFSVWTSPKDFGKTGELQTLIQTRVNLQNVTIKYYWTENEKYILIFI